jgi:aspartate/tyrosine/aromatic aminotransferase
MGPVEILTLMIFAFSALAGLVGNSLVKGVIAAALGLLFASIGSDPENYTPRLIFGMWDRYDGLPLASVAIGMLAISEILRRLSEAGGKVAAAIDLIDTGDPDDRRVTWDEYWSCRYVMLRGAVTGTILGALPGIGSTAAAFMSYAFTKAASNDPQSFGKGNIQGIAAAESANSAVVGANLIPLLTLGIPGSVGAALIISAFMIHGLQPGPLLFENQGRLVYGLFGAMIMANFINLWVGQLGLRFWVKIVSAPISVIFSAAILMCIVGVSMATSGLFGVGVMLVFAVLGYRDETGATPVLSVVKKAEAQLVQNQPSKSYQGLLGDLEYSQLMLKLVLGAQTDTSRIAVLQTPGGVAALLQASCHNPTGVDLTPRQWDEVIGICKTRGLLPVIDVAYQGFDQGLDSDAYGPRKAFRDLPEMMITATCSKNFSIYRDRVAIAAVLTKSPENADRTLSRLRRLANVTYAMPADHAAAVVKTILLSDSGLRDEWHAELTAMRMRVQHVRQTLAQALRRATNSDRFDFLERHRGMFSLLPLTEGQIDALQDQHGICLVKGGRMNIAGLKSAQIDQFATAVAQVVSN